MPVRASAKSKPASDAAAAPKRASGRTRRTGEDGTAPRTADLVAELDAARRRIAELEAQQAEILHRIDWVIDSIQTVVSEDEENAA
jgi:hypothetical protein